MAAHNRSALGYFGYPAQVFYEKINYGKGTQTYEEKRVILHKWYSDLRAWIPEQLKTDEEITFYNKEISPILDEVAEHIRMARQLYKPTFEDKSCDPDEKDFQQVLDGIVERLDVITAKAKVIDRVRQEGEDVVF